ncbi:signal peptidase I [Malassezia furfur]|uniref:Signal peptidase complex catalytic subunit SEC11 n=1 Tax=Malassezia furfur TaxID=55194 RepID=A0ABY8EKT9_MALFU|nr:SEC11 [Malassezia furfur]WFD46227.1 signal peptidase I [Malassezia furfur]
MFAQLQELQGQPWRRKVFQVVQMLHIIAVALAVWKGLALVTNTESPVVVVLSGSMEPGFYRGDLLFLVKTSRPIEVGDVTVYRARNTEIPIVHRVLETHSASHGQLLLTKGDNNLMDDIMLYNGARWLHSDQIVGRVVGYLPYVGYVTLLMNDYPMLKYVVLGLLGLSMLFERE